jgi:hypothetical protein
MLSFSRRHFAVTSRSSRHGAVAIRPVRAALALAASKSASSASRGRQAYSRIPPELVRCLSAMGYRTMKVTDGDLASDGSKHHIRWLQIALPPKRVDGLLRIISKGTEITTMKEVRRSYIRSGGFRLSVACRGFPINTNGYPSNCRRVRSKPLVQATGHATVHRKHGPCNPARAIAGQE